MSKAVRVVRSSQGDEDKISLDVQRNDTKELAEDLGVDDLETIDLGIHTGFSVFMRPDKDERIDNNPQIEELLDCLEAGEYDYLLAYDETRLSRDDFFTIIWYHCIKGGVEMKFVEEFNPQDISDRVERLVEIFVKLKEMEKAKRAREQRLEEGAYEGGTPTGMEFDKDGMYLVPNEDFEAVLDILRMRTQGKSYSEVLESTDITSSRGTLANILDRQEDYIEWAFEHDYDVDGLLEEA